MAQFRSRPIWTAVGLALLAFVQPASPAAEAAVKEATGPRAQESLKAPTPVPIPWPPIILVFADDFESQTTYASYTPLGGANVYIANGRLNVDVPAGAPPGSGLRMRLPAGGTGVRCSGFGGLQIPDLGSGQMHWSLIGYDASTGAEVVLIELFITESSAADQDMLSFRYVKNGRGVYAHIETDKKASDIKKIQWDVKDGGRKVQAEVTFNDGSKASSPWIDPEESTIGGFDVTTDAAEFSADGTAGTEVHANSDVDPSEPAPIERFESDALTNLYPHWLIQAHDADAALVATVARVGRIQEVPFADGPRRRLAVHYFLDETLYGHPGADRFTVFHVLGKGREPAELRPGDRVLLFVKGGDEGFWDFGEPPGVIPYHPQNYLAVASRVELIHGGSAP